MIEFREHSHVVEAVKVGDTAANEPEPAEEVQIAQSAARPLDVWLEQINGFAILLALGTPGGDEFAAEDRCAPLDHGVECQEVAVVDGGVSEQEPGFDERGSDLGFGSGELNRLDGGSHTLPQLDAGVEDVLGQAAGKIGDEPVGLPLVEEHHVDVGERGLLAPAIAAVGDQGDSVAKLGGVSIRKVGERSVVNSLNRRVVERRKAGADLYAVEPAIVLLSELLAAFDQMLSSREHTRT